MKLITTVIIMLMLPSTSAILLDGEIIIETFFVNDSINLTINNSRIYSKNFMEIKCQEDIEIGLVNCSDINISLTITNSRIYSDFIIYSDEIMTSNIHINNNWYYDYNNVDSLYVWEHNHDIIDYNPVKTKPLNRRHYQIKS